MVECPICYEEVEVHEMTYDETNGQCCTECSDYFQGERDMYSDNMRKLEKEDMYE